MKWEVRPGAEWPLVLSTGLLISEPLLDVLDGVKKAGFSSIEIAASIPHFDYHDSNAVSQVKKKLDGLVMKVNSFHAPYKDVDLTLLEEGERLKAVREVLAAAGALSALGGRFLVLHGGSEEQAIPEEEIEARLEQAGKSLLEIHERSGHLGLTLAVEDMLGHLVGGKLEQVMWLVARLPENGTGICLDTGHSFLTGKLLERAAAFGPLLLMAHIHDNNGVYDDHLPPGDGQLPWYSLFQAFAEQRFCGPLVLELIGRGDTAARLEAAARAAAFIRQLTYYRTSTAPPTAAA